MVGTVLFLRDYNKGKVESDEHQAIEASAAGKLPPELWELIAIKMPAKEWAKARGTCRAMLKAKRTVLQLAPVSTKELMWTVKAVPDAKKLWLDVTALPFGVCSASSFRNVWEDQNAGLQRLQQLSLIMSSKKKLNTERQKAASKWLAAIAEILATAQDLVTLRLDLPDVPTLPPMTKLEHVNLITHQPLTQQTCQWLQSLPSLQTLSIKQSPDVSSAAAFEIPPLDLSSNQHLRAVSLFHIVPKEFSAPASCSVTLWTDPEAVCPKWHFVYSSICTACSFFMARPHPKLDLLDNLPDDFPEVSQCHFQYMLRAALAPATNLTVLRIDLPYASLARHNLPLWIGYNLPHLRAFRCRAQNIFLSFGDTPRLESLRCNAETALGLRVRLGRSETILAVLHALKYMHFFWGHGVHGSTKHQLMKDFRQAGYDCDMSSLDNGSIEAKYCAAGYTPSEEEKLCLGCSACGICLTQKHSIIDLFVPPASTRFRRGISP
ncbi:hypothetical protein COCOBI_01-8720 [Coccomyxa sp. Obi]|nr:hypothetical protein COCOBI_01-8720 [Coccomyxa sp. Obi]